MQIQLLGQGAFASALVTLEPGETFVSESGALFRSSPNVEVDVTTKSKGSGGVLAGLKRLMGGDSFFLSTYRTNDGRRGEVGLAPVMQGHMQTIAVTPGTPWMCAGGSWVGSSEGIALETRFQGLKGLFTGESLFYLRCAGEGGVLVSSFGVVRELEVDGSLVVDTGHVVAFEETLTYRLSKAGASWIHSFLGGEGIVMVFEGRGRIWVQSHNATAFGRSLGRLLPPREA